MTKVYAPVRGFNGLGPAGIMFQDGVAETTDQAALAYFRRAGYGVGDDPLVAGSPAPEHTFEPEVPAEVPLGQPLRDAAVAPLPKDFLPPTNAGEADPHGPLVVAPGIHAAEGKPIRPGPVAVDDPKAQKKAETDLAQAVLVENRLVPEVMAEIAAEASAPTGDPDAHDPLAGGSDATPEPVPATDKPRKAARSRRAKSSGS